MADKPDLFGSYLCGFEQTACIKGVAEYEHLYRRSIASFSESAAVVGPPRPVKGQGIHAFVTLKPGFPASQQLFANPKRSPVVNLPAKTS